MKAVITVLGKDTVGIIYKVSKVLYELNINIDDISQTVLQDYFTMIMLVSSSKEIAISEINQAFEPLNEEGLIIRVQKTDIFDIMHRI